MCFQRKTILGGLVMTTLLIVLITACNKNEEEVVSPYVQDIVPAQQEPASWHLSPVGDKLLYNTRLSQKQLQATIRVLATGQEFTIADCARFRWLDNDRVYCYGLLYDTNYEPFVATIDISTKPDSIQTSFIKAVTATPVELARLLEQPIAIYRLDSSSEPDSLLVDTGPQDKTSQYYHITGIENLDQVLENKTYTTISLDNWGAELSKRRYSPNRKYYYILQDINLGIYDAAGDQLLAEVKSPSKQGAFFQIGGDNPNKSEGWASDNSGVYFRIVYSGGFYGPIPPILPIQKLCVPGSPGCPQ